MGIYKTITDETLMENISHGSKSYPFAYYPENIWHFDFHRIDWHWHHEVEFLFAAEGSPLCLIGTDKIELPKGFGLFVNSGILHRFEAKSSAFFPNVVFSPTLLAAENSLVYEKYIQPVIGASLPYQILDPQIKWQSHALEILSEVFALQEAEEKNELHTIQLLFQIWELLHKHLNLSSHPPSLRRLDHKQARLQTMMQYIHEHYMEGITLETIAASASISKSGALQLFQAGIQSTPVAYLIQYRLAQAALQLRATQKPIFSISEETGFSSSGYFCRKFRQHYHMSPNEYRKKKLNSAFPPPAPPLE